MVDSTYIYSHAVRNPDPRSVPAAHVGDSSARLTLGQTELLNSIPDTDDVIDLADAVRIVSADGRHAYGSIVTLMNRGLVAAEFLDAPSVDPEIVLRRL